MPEVEGDPLDPETDSSIAYSEQLKTQKDMAKARGLLEVRQGSFRRVFKQGTPSRDDRDIVNKDLKRFCRGGETTYHDSERVHVLMTGRQEVYLRIEDFLNLSVDELLLKYTTNREA